MKLCYRGIRYDYNNTVSGTPLTAVAPSQPYSLSYRGQSYQIDPTKAAALPATLPPLALVYRGVQYILNGDKATQSTAISLNKALRSGSPLRRFTRRAAALADISATHRANICRSLERRISAAEANGDQALVQLLQQELRHIA